MGLDTTTRFSTPIFSVRRVNLSEGETLAGQRLLFLLTLTSLIPGLGQHSGAEDEEDSQGQQQRETAHLLQGAGAGDTEL